MKKELNPLVLIGIAALAVIVLVIFGYRALAPAPYQASPGAGGSAADDPWLKTHPGQPTQQTTATTPDGKPYYPSAAPGSMPGRPVNSAH
jgi:hypothetical protein